MKLRAGTRRTVGEQEVQWERASHRGHRGGMEVAGEAFSGDAAQVEAPSEAGACRFAPPYNVNPHNFRLDLMHAPN
jgi:hypothetical protein